MAIDVQSGKGQRRGRGRPEMNVTPLVDVVLVLLIIFMVVTPLMSKQFWIHMPDLEDEAEDQAAADDSLEPIVVTVNARGAIQINREEVPDAQLVPRLRRMLAARQSRTIFFDAHDDAAFARAAEALDLARGGGATTIAVLTEAIR